MAFSSVSAEQRSAETGNNLRDTSVFSISYNLKVNEEDIIVIDRKLIFIRLTPAIRKWFCGRYI